MARGSVQDWAVTLLEMGILLSATALFLGRSLSWQWRWERTVLDGPLSVLTLLVLASAAASRHHRTSLWAVVLFLGYLLVFHLAVHLIRTRSSVRTTIRIILWTAVVVAAIGFLKGTGSPLVSWWVYEHENPLFRMSATFGNADHLAGYMEMVLLLALGSHLYPSKPAGGRSGWVLIAVLAATLLFTLSRGGWIGAIAGLYFLIIFHYRLSAESERRIAATLLVLISAVALVVLMSTPVAKRIRTFEHREKMPSLQGRMAVWRATIEMAKDHPIFGVGPGNYSNVFQRYQPHGAGARYFFAHNDYLHFLSELGLLLVPILVWTAVRFFRQGIRKLGSSSRLVVGTTLGAMSGIVAILVHSAGDFNLHIPANALLFVILAALVVSPEPGTDGPARRKLS